MNRRERKMRQTRQRQQQALEKQVAKKMAGKFVELIHEMLDELEAGEITIAEIREVSEMLKQELADGFEKNV